MTPLHAKENVFGCPGRGPAPRVADVVGLLTGFSDKFPDDTLKLVWESHCERDVEGGPPLYAVTPDPGQ